MTIYLETSVDYRGASSGKQYLVSTFNTDIIKIRDKIPAFTEPYKNTLDTLLNNIQRIC